MLVAIDRFFGISDSQSSFKQEIVGGITTFMTMAYIIIVNPIILSPAFIVGLDSASKDQMLRALVCATCLGAASATFIMGIFAKYPIALAPGMGLNAIFTYTICLGMKVPWQIALGMVFISGLIFLILSVVRIREMIIDAVPENLKLSAAVGIGIFIAFIGLRHAGVIVASGATLVRLGKLTSLPVLVSIAGLFITTILYARNVKGSILLGIVITGIIAWLAGLVRVHSGWIESPTLEPVFGKLDISGALSVRYLSPILVLLFFDMFDTVGTLIGVSQRAGFMKDGKLPRANLALFSDAAGTVLGSIFGTSTVTSYIESSAGIADGARTGLANIVTALLFLVAMFFAPIAEMFGSGLASSETVVIGGKVINFTDTLYPVTAPALIVVGCLMMGAVSKIDWNDWTESIPSFLTIVLMPLTFSISTGLFAGLLSYPIIKIATGRYKDVHWLLYALSGIFGLAIIMYFLMR